MLDSFPKPYLITDENNISFREQQLTIGNLDLIKAIVSQGFYALRFDRI